MNQKKRVEIFLLEKFFKSIVKSSFTILLCLMSVGAIAQTTITGNITDASNKDPLPGVTVYVKGLTGGTISDFNGNYSLSVEKGNTIVFSFIGYDNYEVLLADQSIINVELQPSVELLDEVVAIGYGSAKKSDLTGSVVSVKSEQVANKSVANLSEGLQGMASGVQVVRTSGKPGESANVVIRGVATINNSTKPLYVVDGIMVGSNADFLNPSDIESIEVLKDASATAIYGSRGANGVIMVTTKKGSSDGSFISAKATFGVNTLSGKIDVADMAGFTAVANQMNINDGTTPNPTWSDPSKLNYIDWQDEMTETTLRQQYHMTASGGSESVQASMSVGYLNDKGVIKGSDYTKITSRSNIDMKVNDFIKTGISLIYTREEGEGNGNLYDYAALVPTMDYRDATGNIVHEPVQHPDGTWGYFHEANSSSTYVNKNLDNPVAVAETAEGPWFKNRTLANAYLEITLLEGLTIKTINGVNYNAGGGHWYGARHNRTINASGIDNFSVNNWSNIEYLTENFVTYNNTFGSSRVNLMAGFSANQRKGQTIRGGASDFPSPNIRQIDLTQDPGSEHVSGGLNLESRQSSLFGRANYTYKDRYIATATIRRDGSSNFGPGNRFGTFPSASVAWRITEEDFINIEQLSNLKLRLGWGQTGNSGYATNRYKQQVSSDRIMFYTYDYANPTTHSPAAGIAPSVIVDENLKWETNEQTNIGIDLGLFDNSITLAFDYFKRDAKDLLLYSKVRPSTGYNNVYTNTGQIRNTGFEILLGYQKRFGDWMVDVKLNGSKIKNEAIKIGDPIYFGSSDDNYDDILEGMEWENYSVTQEGYAVGSWYGYQTDGIFQSDGETQLRPSLPGSKAGDRIYKDISGPNGEPDGQITADDKTIIGNGQPDFTYGVNVNLGWKNFDFALNAHGVAGQDVLSFAYANMIAPVYQPGGGMRNVSPDILENSWTPQNTSASNPRLTRTNFALNARVSDAYIQKGDFFKIQSIQFGYTIPNSVLSKVKMKSARLSFSVDNVATFSSYKFGDPEVGNSDPRATGFDAGRYPFPRVYSFGVSVGI
ncbi:TonB-dependent receptor [Labilibacter sediminis]|nr:TonB-dependent receptor [Labilibacter sediminis]